MPREELPPDPEALEQWRRLPQTPPSRDALPPLTGGSRWLNGLMFMGILLILLIWLMQGR